MDRRTDGQTDGVAMGTRGHQSMPYLVIFQSGVARTARHFFSGKISCKMETWGLVSPASAICEMKSSPGAPTSR